MQSPREKRAQRVPADALGCLPGQKETRACWTELSALSGMLFLESQRVLVGATLGRRPDKEEFGA